MRLLLPALLIGVASCGNNAAPVAPPPPPSSPSALVAAPTASEAPAPPAPPPPPSASASPVVNGDKPEAPVAEPKEAPVIEEAMPPASADQKAFVTGPLLGTEVVFITVAAATETCASVTGSSTPAKGDKRASVRVQWAPGYYDFSNRMAEGKLASYQGTFWLKEDATRGGVNVRAAPIKKGTIGRIHVTGSRPGSAQSIDAELEALVCVDLELKRSP